MGEHAITKTIYDVVRREDYQTGHILLKKTEGDETTFILHIHKVAQVTLGGVADAERVLALLLDALGYRTTREASQGGKDE